MGHPSEVVLSGVISEYNQPLVSGFAALNPQLDGGFSTRHWGEADFNKRFANNDERDMVAATLGEAVVGGGIVGSLYEQALEATSGYVGGIIVADHIRGKGTGVKIMWQLDESARDMGLPAIALNTEDHRPDAIHLYKNKVGYVEVDGTKGHYAKSVPAETHPLIVPRDVIRGYHGTAPTFTGQLTGGLLHGTHYSETWGPDGVEKRGILQRISPALDERLVAENAIVTHMLKAGGRLLVPGTVPTQEGSHTFKDRHGYSWRQLEFIDSDGDVPELTTREQLEDVGAYVAKVHAALAELDYTPAYSIPNFHNTDHYAGRLQELQPRLADDAFAGRLLDAYKKLRPNLPQGKTQLIHGDIQPTNMLFRDGKPLAAIDWDTTMLGTIWMDLGDMLRATVETDVKAGRPLEIEKLRPIVEGYRREAGITDDPEEFYGKCAKATQQIALELAMRFTNDLAEGARYFGADDAKLVELANIQWDIYEALEAQQNV